MNAVQQYRKACAALNARKRLYETRIIPHGPRDYEWRLYAGMTVICAAGVADSAASAQREAKEALRVRVEYPEHFTHEKAASVIAHAAA